MKKYSVMDEVNKIMINNPLAYQESSWHLSSPYEMCMDEVSRRINGETYVTAAVAEVVGANLEMLQLRADNQIEDTSLDVPAQHQEVMTGHTLPSIGVNYLLTEIAEIKYDMPRKRAQYKGAAFNYATAIDAVALFVGISRMEKDLKDKRKELVAVRLATPRGEDEPRLEVLAPDPFVWKNLHKPSTMGSNAPDRRSNLWCVRPSLKRRITDFATDFGINYSVLGEMLMIIAWEDFSRIDPYYLQKFEKEVKRIYDWLNKFRAEESVL